MIISTAKGSKMKKSISPLRRFYKVMRYILGKFDATLKRVRKGEKLEGDMEFDFTYEGNEYRITIVNTSTKH